MKLVCNLPSIDDLNDFKDYVDGILIKTKENMRSTIQKVLDYGILPILQWDEMVLPKEIEEYSNQIELTKDLDCMYYVTDLGLAHLLKKANLLDRTIFDPITMITNSLDAKEFQNYGFHAIGLSNEITIEDTKEIIQRSHCKAFLQAFG
ncbi:MAG: hypothetical protein K2N65_04200, partial [Anaeroplasmataceae bacterium]|nr:hypothetical protein [Anaeroplasmataceae bacterium]